jgi:hypothetical protein
MAKNGEFKLVYGVKAGEVGCEMKYFKKILGRLVTRK